MLLWPLVVAFLWAGTAQGCKCSRPGRSDILCSAGFGSATSSGLSHGVTRISLSVVVKAEVTSRSMEDADMPWAKYRYTLRILDTFKARAPSQSPQRPNEGLRA